MFHETRSLFYGRYVEWKSWGSDQDPAALKEMFEVEMSRAGVARGAAVLEIGFGSGAFLDWARESGYRTEGIEINPDLVAAAKDRGHAVDAGDPREILRDRGATYDAIVCLDVLEHQTLPELIEYLEVFSNCLKHNGKIVARFPNGGSPFGRLYQYGDATHMTVLTGPLMRQLAMVAGLKVIGEYNAARSNRGPGGGGIKNSVVARKITFLLRDAINAVLSLIYFGRIVPFDPNMTVVIAKA